MRRRENKWVFIALGIMVLAMVGLLYIQERLNVIARQETSSMEITRHIAFIGDQSNSFQKEIYEAARQAGLPKGVYVEFTGSDMETKYNITTLMKIAVASDVDGIIVYGDSSDRLKSAINMANNKGIPVVCVGNDNYGSARASFVGISSYALGQEYGKCIAGYQKDVPQDVLIFTGTGGSVSTQSLVVSGMIDYITKAGKSQSFNFTTENAGDGTMFSAAEAVTDLFARDTIPSILVCLDETTTTAVCQAIVDANQVGNVTAMGFYLNDTIRNALSKNVMAATITVSPELLGEESLNCMNEYLDTGFVTEYVPIDIVTVTQQNVAEQP